MKLLVAKGVTSNVGKSHEVSWSAFCALMRSYSVAMADESNETKRAAYWFSTSEYRGNLRRRENIIGKPWAVVADLDGVFDEKKVLKALSRWEYIAWTTWNSTPEEPRWRVVLPVEGGIDLDRFGAIVDKVLSPIGKNAKIDVRSRMPEQLWFCPIHKRSQASNHTIWTNSGSWIRDSEVIKVDFTGVRMANKPEEIGKGERNSTLVIRLGEADALRCESQAELLEIALEWNSRLPDPMPRHEVRQVVVKKWRWMQRGDGLSRRADAWRGHLSVDDLPDIGVGLLSNEIRTAKLPPSLVGDFLYPGATMISAKMKEGKSYIAMQLALSVATAVPFLANAPKHMGFPVRAKQKTIIIAGEDTAGGIAHRFLGSIAAGHLPTIGKNDDIKLVFNDDLDEVRRIGGRIHGLALFETLIERWYKQGYRIIAVDPLRVLEAALRVDEYPGTSKGMNAHARDFHTMRYYTKVAQKYDDLVIIISMHHGKNKRDHDGSDPGDMIAGTTGFGAAAITTISLLPVPESLNATEGKGGLIPKRRELYLHGRYTREQRVLVEQSPTTGVWIALGLVHDELTSDALKTYYEALMRAGGTEKWVSAEEIAKAVGARTPPKKVHAILNKAMREGSNYLGWRLTVKRGIGGGYKFVESVPGTRKEKP